MGKNIFVLIILSSLSLFAVDTRDLVLMKPSASLDRVLSTISLDKKFFSPSVERFKPKSILFLGDNDAFKGHNSLAEIHKIFLQRSGIDFVKSDIACKDSDQSSSGIKTRKIDHTKRFPFENESFNIILGSRILCTCNKFRPNTVCGGLNSQDSYISFFSEILRVLRKKKNSFAFIGGQNFSQSQWQDDWIKVAQIELTEQHPKIKYFRVVYVSKKNKITRIGVALGNAEFWKNGYWSDKCTACPAKLYEKKHCTRSGFVVTDERPCGKGLCRGFCNTTTAK